MSISCFGQPGSNPIAVYRALETKATPFSDQDVKELEASRNEVRDYLQRDDIEIPVEKREKLTLYHYLLQDLIVRHQSHQEKPDQKEIERWYATARRFVALPTKNREFQQRQEVIKASFAERHYRAFRKLATQQEMDAFLSNPEQAEWFNVTLDLELARRYQETAELTLDPYRRKQLYTQIIPCLESSCASFYSGYPCGMVYAEEAIQSCDAEIAAAEQREARRQAEDLRITNEERKHKATAARADSLFKLRDIDAAMATYDSIPLQVRLDDMEPRWRQVSDAWVARRQAERQKYIHDHFLYDTLGQLRIDHNFNMSGQALAQLKGNRVEISKALITALKRNDEQLYLKHRAASIYHHSQRQIISIPRGPSPACSYLYTVVVTPDTLKLTNHQLMDGTDNPAFNRSLQAALPQLHPLLKPTEDTTYTYHLPVQWKPSPVRELADTSFLFYYCNCHHSYHHLNHPSLSCDQELLSQERNSADDEFYFVVSETADKPEPPHVIEPQRLEPIYYRRTIFGKRRATKPRQIERIKRRNKKREQ